MATNEYAPLDAAGTLRVLSALLSYPDSGLRARLTQAGELLRTEAALSPAGRAQVERLIASLSDQDPFEVESAYLETFDRGRATSLHLFEHVHGDSRERGPALVDLGRTYEQAGLILEEGELPDYLPVVLEYASTQPPREARAFLGEIAHLLAVIGGALQRRHSPYAGVLAALLELAGAEVIQEQAPVTTGPEESLDESWAEPPVFQGCSLQGQGRPSASHPVRFHPAPGAHERAGRDPSAPAALSGAIHQPAPSGAAGAAPGATP